MTSAVRAMMLAGHMNTSHSIAPIETCNRAPVIRSPILIANPSRYFQGLFHIIHVLYTILVASYCHYIGLVMKRPCFFAA